MLLSNFEHIHTCTCTCIGRHMHTYKMYMYICPGQLIFSKNGCLEMFVLCFVGLHQLSGVTEDPRSLISQQYQSSLSHKHSKTRTLHYSLFSHACHIIVTTRLPMCTHVYNMYMYIHVHVVYSLNGVAQCTPHVGVWCIT